MDEDLLGDARPRDGECVEPLRMEAVDARPPGPVDETERLPAADSDAQRRSDHSHDDQNLHLGSLAAGTFAREGDPD
jgi:hypothetical protein